MWRSFGSVDDCGLISYKKSTLDAIFVHAQQFKYLYLNGNFEPLLSEVSIEYLYDKLSLCSNLEELDLTSNFAIISVPFLAKLHKLKLLSIEWCINIDRESSTVILSDEYLCPNIKHLNIRCCNQFTFWDILQIVAAHPSIETLDVSFTSVMNEDGVLALINFLPNIKSLILSPELESRSIEEWKLLRNE